MSKFIEYKIKHDVMDSNYSNSKFDLRINLKLGE